MTPLAKEKLATVALIGRQYLSGVDRRWAAWPERRRLGSRAQLPKSRSVPRQRMRSEESVRCPRSLTELARSHLVPPRPHRAKQPIKRGSRTMIARDARPARPLAPVSAPVGCRVGVFSNNHRRQRLWRSASQRRATGFWCQVPRARRSTGPGLRQLSYMFPSAEGSV
jgi:hypothetical protein